ncbi:uncharacterized protein LOC116344800 isoform X1 [Contarinia nasturtii]|uniref:uncharacterized protein LOC116344800 isoform X1 n=1 Tax=Contarinia nasturtii TaxID=265458 RepID=UPI0012D3F78E|nr:uncharacterized protein LOC116344800 isoform X1 [Contarinia nasturtii]XP_031629414.1 uncharacterized protein LOC116344800 isoform X1 [Contarinia nasturtii]XP_031629416.1 uncharacterized protein LOC116344800 isoform X1 [Contarinia nasturtii]
MSHGANITVTRTVTTSNPNVIIINKGYLKTLSGALKIVQLILGGVVIGLLLKNFYDYPYYNFHNNHPYIPHYGYNVHVTEVLLVLVLAVVFFILSACLLLSCIFSLSTGGLISKTLYEFLYHLVGFILLLIASILLYVKINKYNLVYYDYYLAAVIVCGVNSILYLASTVVAFREYRN